MDFISSYIVTEIIRKMREAVTPFVRVCVWKIHLIIIIYGMKTYFKARDR